jgi:hypothetical protein
VAKPPDDLENLVVIDVGDATGAPAPKLPVAATPAPPPIHLLQPDFVNDSAGEQKLELDSSWERERATKKPAASVGAQRIAAETARRPSPARASSVWPLVVLVVVAGLGAGAYYMFGRDATPKPPAKVVAPDRGVTIRIIGADGTPVTIDGKPAGKTPLSLQRRPGKKALVIGAKGSTWQVVPDRDQTIDVENR